MVVVCTFESIESILADGTFLSTFPKCLTIGDECVGVGGHVCAEEASQKVKIKIGWKVTHHNVPRHMMLACEVNEGRQVGRPGYIREYDPIEEDEKFRSAGIGSRTSCLHSLRL